MWPLIVFFQHFPDKAAADPNEVKPETGTIRQYVVFWSGKFSLFYKDQAYKDAVFEPDISDFPTGATEEDLPSRLPSWDARRGRIIRAAFYDVRSDKEPMMVLDSVGLPASLFAIDRQSVYLRLILRNALSPYWRKRSNTDPNESLPYSELDFQGPVFSAVLLAADQDIVPTNQRKTTANLKRVVIAEKDFEHPGSPARYAPRRASDWNAPAPDTTPWPDPVDPTNEVPLPENDPGLKRRPSEEPVSGLPGGAGSAAMAAAGIFRTLSRFARRKGVIRAAYDEDKHPQGRRNTTRIADLVGHARENETVQWFPAGSFETEDAIPFAKVLGLASELEAAHFFVWEEGLGGEKSHLDSPHWTRRMRLHFERGPALPSDPRIRTIEIAFSRAFQVKRDIVLANTDPQSYRSQLPLTLYLEKRWPEQGLNRLLPGGEDCQDDRNDYRFVQRQPPLWCAERRAVRDPTQYLVALEVVSLNDVIRMWNRDIAGRYYGGVSSARNDRRLSFFPEFEHLDPGGNSTSALRFSLIFGLSDRVRMFGESRYEKSGRFKAPHLDMKPSLWRIEAGTLRDAADRALGYLYASENEAGEINAASHDPTVTRLTEKIYKLRRSSEQQNLYQPERLHAAGKVNEQLVCRTTKMFGSLSRAESKEALSAGSVPGPKCIKTWGEAAAFRAPEPQRLNFGTRLFVDSTGRVLQWSGIVNFMPKAPSGDAASNVSEHRTDNTPATGEFCSDGQYENAQPARAAAEGTPASNGQEGGDEKNEAAPDRALRISDLRFFAGLSQQSFPTGPSPKGGQVRPPFISFSVESVEFTGATATAAVDSATDDSNDDRATVESARSLTRLGAFDIEFEPQKNSRTREAGAVQVWLTPIDYIQGGGAHPYQVHTKTSYSVPVRSVRPGTQDDIDGADLDRTRSPIHIPLRDKTETEEPKDIAIRIQEDAYHLTRQSIQIDLLADKLPGTRLVVLDTAPLLIAGIQLDAVENEESRVIARWESDAARSATWRIEKQASGYEVTLPSSAVGETVARDRDYGLKSRPHDGDGDITGFEDLSDFRFSPPVKLRLGSDPRFSDRTQVEPPFNTRRIFGTARDRAPGGAPLFNAEFELLYGLMAKVTGVGNLILRETGSDIGRVPEVIDADIDGRNTYFTDTRSLLVRDFATGQGIRTPGQRRVAKVRDLQKNARQRLSEGWSHVVGQVEARPATLSLQRLGKAYDDTLTQGIEFRLRDAADIAAPVELSETGYGQTPYGQNKLRHTEHRKKYWAAPDKPGGTHPPLEGGADAGFQSANIYRELWRNPGSVDGELTSVSFTAFGGGGAQRAVFAKGKQKIISKASQGRTHYYSLERIGRIATYWNRAKHVIIYERTTSATEQFRRSQPELKGRPVLRKVREYVEILQPQRAFPEDTAKPERCGPVQGLRFDALIIPVDSAWGSDVGKFGWKVPLFQRGADGYVEPPIDFEMATDNRSGLSFRLCRCLSPEKIFFYTSTLDSDGPDPDMWPMVPEVDFPIVPKPRPRPTPTHDKNDIDARLPSEEDIPFGIDLFTQEIDAAEGLPINLGARRTQQAMVASLRNITVARSSLNFLDDTEAEVLAGASQANAAVREVFGAISDIVEDVESASDVPAELAKALEKKKQDILNSLPDTKFASSIKGFADPVSAPRCTTARPFLK